MKSEGFILEKAIFTTKNYSHALNLKTESASRKLHSLAKENVIKKAVRGLWYNPKHPQFSVFAFTPFILGQEHGYVSFLSALNYWGAISQIPQKIFLATTGHARVIKFSSFQFELIQIKPEFMQHGIEWKENFAIANLEKALIDCFYLSSRKGKRFYHLPELDLEEIKKTNFKKLLKLHKFSEPIENHIRLRSEIIFK